MQKIGCRLRELAIIFSGGQDRRPRLSDEPRKLRGLSWLQISRLHRVRLRLHLEKEGETEVAWQGRKIDAG